MEKTVLVLAGNCLMQKPSGRSITVDLTLGKGKGSSNTKTFVKSVWTCCIEGISEYSRLIFDLFPNKSQVCIVSANNGECSAVNTWRDEDQDLGKVLKGFQSYAMSYWSDDKDQPPPYRAESTVQGLKFGIMCLSQLTATQFAQVQLNPEVGPVNKGRLILVTALQSPNGVAELHRHFVDLMESENESIEPKDKSRLPIAHVDFVLFNVNTDAKVTNKAFEGVKISKVPSVNYTTVSVGVGDVQASFIKLVKSHFNLSTTLIMGIPMKEDQSGGNSANYDVELYHHSDAHRDILRAGKGVMNNSGDREGSNRHSADVQEVCVKLKWSNPKQNVGLEMMGCSSAFRVTPAQVTSRPTVCLINFVLSGKAVMLEQPRRSGVGKLISHMLISHKGAIFLHSIPQGKSPLEDPPSMTEGCGGRVTDYRISDFVDLMSSNKLVHHCVQRTKMPIPTPLEQAMLQLERQTRVWPVVFSDSLLYSMQQELDPLLRCITEAAISDEDYDKCRQVIVDLQNREMSNEALPLPQAGSRAKGAKRDELYHQLWVELEELLYSHRTNSERHSKLLDIVQVVSKESPSNRLPRKQPNHGLELEPMETDSHQKAEDDRRNGSDRHQGLKPSVQSEEKSRSVTFTSTNKTETLLSLWTNTAKKNASGKHVEFVGRKKYGEKSQ